MNPLEILQAIQNPKQYVLSQFGKGSNPMLENLINLAQQGKTEEVEKIAKNIFQSQGIDFDKQIRPLIKK